MKTNFLIILPAIILCLETMGQDTLLYKSGGRVPVTILSEGADSAYVQNYNDTSIATRFTVYKKNLNGIKYQNDSARFAAMAPSDFYSLGEKHAREYGVPSEALVKNPEYVNGYNHKMKKMKTTRTAIVAGVASLVIVGAIIVVSNDLSSMNLGGH